MKTAYRTPVETGRKHFEDMFRKQPKIMKRHVKPYKEVQN
jgi:hypothetical protein